MVIKIGDRIIKVHTFEEVDRNQIVQRLAELQDSKDEVERKIAGVQKDLADFDSHQGGIDG